MCVYCMLPFPLRRTCVSHCPAGYYQDSVARRCRRCQTGCERCSGCCRRGLYLNELNSTCTAACPPGYYGDDGETPTEVLSSLA